jgi:hypothetical protein
MIANIIWNADVATNSEAVADLYDLTSTQSTVRRRYVKMF